MQSKGPEFIRFFKPIIMVLIGLGGSGTVAEVIDAVIEKTGISESEQGVTLKNGQSRVRNQVQWARLYLVRAGYLDASKRGIWNLTEKGLACDLKSFDTLGTFKEVSRAFREEKKERQEQISTVEEETEQEIEPSDYKSDLIGILRLLPPAGFERLCQRLLRESGFQQVVVTGRAGDGGIDGYGILEVNAFVSFNVLFQCKRYSGAVTPSQVREFRGAMGGRADKGIILTTGTFTLEARKEARRDGVPPIELVDGDKLIKMFEQLQLGLRPKSTFEIDLNFFEEFKKE